MISAALSVFLLREQSWSDFEFPRGQVVAALTLMGLLTGLSLAMLVDADGQPLFPLQGAVLLGLTFNALLYGLVHAMLRRWLMRDGRWDGRGPLFNLLVAAGLLPNILSALFESLELPPDLAQLSGVAVALWGLWTVSRALSWLIPKADTRFAMAGMAVSSVFSVSVLAVLAMGVLMAFEPEELQQASAPGATQPANATAPGAPGASAASGSPPVQGAPAAGASATSQGGPAAGASATSPAAGSSAASPAAGQPDPSVPHPPDTAGQHGTQADSRTAQAGQGAQTGNQTGNQTGAPTGQTSAQSGQTARTGAQPAASARDAQKASDCPAEPHNYRDRPRGELVRHQRFDRNGQAVDASGRPCAPVTPPPAPGSADSAR